MLELVDEHGDGAAALQQQPPRAAGGRTVRVGVDQAFKKNALRAILALAEPGSDRLLIAPREGMWTATPPMIAVSDHLMDEIGRLEGVLSVEA